MADDKEMALAQVYGRAMHDLAVKQGAADSLAEELEELAGLIERDERLADFLASPLVDVEERARALDKLFRGRASDLLADSLQVINGKGRLGLLATIAGAYHLQHQEHLGRVDVHVRSAVPLSAGLRAKLIAALEKHSGKQPELVETVDESLIGGMVLRVADEKIDASVAREIERLRRVLRERAEHEIHSSRRAAAEAAS